MRCEIPHRCVRRKYRIRRHSPFRLRNCWEGRSVRASSLLRQLAKGGCAARRLSWVTPGFSQSRRCKTTASAKLACLQVDSRGSPTDWNVKGLLQGQSDIPLNTEGEKQAVEAAKKHFKKIKFAAIFSSDLVRAKRTAQIIALEKKMAVETSALLRERDFGPFEGKHWQGVPSSNS